MAERNVFTDRQLQDYIDGRLNERDRAAVAAYLLAHPGVAADVEAVRRQSEALRALGQEILDEPVPEPLRQVLRDPSARSRAEAEPVAPRAPRQFARGFLAAAAAILLLSTGGALGWLAHGIAYPAPSLQDRLLTDMAYAYAFYGARDYPVVFPPERAKDFIAWIGRSFQREVRPPDLADFGYSYRGGRVIPSAGTRIGLFHFERPQTAGLAIFFWAAGTRPKVVHALSEHEGIAAHFWNVDGLNFAVISDKANQDLAPVAEAIFTFYKQAFGAS
jgi:anti-sigma factor RsiW